MPTEAARAGSVRPAAGKNPAAQRARRWERIPNSPAQGLGHSALLAVTAAPPPRAKLDDEVLLSSKVKFISLPSAVQVQLSWEGRGP